MRHAPGASDRVGDRRLNVEPLRIEPINKIATEQCFSAEEMRAAGDIEHETVGRIEPDQRRITIAPIGDGEQQTLVGIGIGVHAAKTRIHGARIGKRHADFKSEARGVVC